MQGSEQCSPRSLRRREEQEAIGREARDKHHLADVAVLRLELLPPPRVTRVCYRRLQLRCQPAWLANAGVAPG